MSPHVARPAGRVVSGRVLDGLLALMAGLQRARSNGSPGDPCRSQGVSSNERLRSLADEAHGSLRAGRRYLIAKTFQAH